MIMAGKKEKPPGYEFGRPTKYNQQILERTALYTTDFEKFGDVIPSIAGLSLVLGVSRDTIHQWVKEEDKQDFSDMVKQLLAKQEQMAMCKGITGAWNATIVKLVLAKHGYTEKSEIDHSSSDKSMSPAPTRIELVAPSVNSKD